MSSPLGLASELEPVAGDVRYFAQSQPQLGTVSLSVEFPSSILYRYTGFLLERKSEEDFANLSLSLVAKPSKDDVPGRSNGSLVVSDVKLPVAVSSSGQEITFQGAKQVYDVRLSSESRASIDVAPEPPLSARQLQEYQAERLHCSTCKVVVADLDRASTDRSASVMYRPLPSAHYHELIEAYMCHPSGEFAKQMEEVGEKGFWPSVTEDGSGVVLVGENNLRVDAALVPDWLRMTSSEVNASPLLMSRWDDVHCHCGALLGERNLHRRPPSDLISASDPSFGLRETIKFWKYAVVAVSRNKEQLSVPAGRHVLNDMLTLAQAHSTRRFIIVEAEDTRAPPESRLNLWLFQSDIEISYGQADMVTSSASHRRSSASKVLYNFDKMTSAQLGQSEDTQSETLIYPRALIDRFLLELDEMRDKQPLSNRRMGVYQVGFILYDIT